MIPWLLRDHTKKHTSAWMFHCLRECNSLPGIGKYIVTQEPWALTWKTYDTGLSRKLGQANSMVPCRAYSPQKFYDFDLHSLPLLSTFPSSRSQKNSWLDFLSSFLISLAFLITVNIPRSFAALESHFCSKFLFCCCY